jgi:hypothetical protein
MVFENSIDEQESLKTSVSDYVDTAAEIPLSTALQAAELFVDHSRQLVPLSIVPTEPIISDLLEQVQMLATPDTSRSTIAGTKPPTFAVSRKAVRCRVTHVLRRKV